MREWWEDLKRRDCRQCKFKRCCGDIFAVEGKCPANTGGERWAKFTPVSPKEQLPQC